jgi:hypothetical protein
MRLAAEREEDIRRLKEELFEKEELLKLNFAEMSRLKDDL